MSTLVVQLTLDPARPEQTTRHLREDVVAWATRQPGFVRGQWLRSDDGTSALGVVEFESRELADAAAKGPRSYVRDDSRAWNIERVEVLDEVARA